MSFKPSKQVRKYLKNAKFLKLHRVPKKCSVNETFFNTTLCNIKNECNSITCFSVPTFCNKFTFTGFRFHIAYKGFLATMPYLNSFDKRVLNFEQSVFGIFQKRQTVSIRVLFYYF